jgi:fructose-specific component phosphotransferase system IIB-like protein
MPDLFSVPLRQLAFGELAAFLAGAEPEPLLWEAKADASPHQIAASAGASRTATRADI